MGTNTTLLYDGNDIYDVDWESAQLDLHREIEENNKKQEEENKKGKHEELHLLKKDLEDKYNKEKMEIEEKLKKQLQDYEVKLKEINQSVEKTKIESERINIENIIKQRIDLLETEKARELSHLNLWRLGKIMIF
jgi:membrane-associated HD superfamily phosphohydrolase